MTKNNQGLSTGRREKNLGTRLSGIVRVYKTDVAWLAKDLCMTSVSASVSLYNLL